MRSPTPLPKSIALFAIGALALSACGTEATDLGTETLQTKESKLYRTGGLWPDGQVPVCWGASSQVPGYATQRGQVMRILNESWPLVAAVEFTGWDNCPSNTGGMVVVNLNGSTAADATVGFNGGSATHTVNLGTARSDFLGGLIPHEFGHILGFSHEMRRPDFSDDSSGSCRESDITGGDTLGTNPDRNSIMASTGYCQTNPYLSPADVSGSQQAYGVSGNWARLTGPEVFDAEYYLNIHPDLSAAFGTDQTAALFHWVTYGFHEGRRSSYEFDVGYYMNRHGDLQNAFGADNFLAGIYHWHNFGIDEGRRGSANLDLPYYLAYHADLTAAFGTNYAAGLSHWLTFGKYEGRRSYPEQP